MPWWDALRNLCILGCVVNGLLLSTARFRQWDEWSDKTREHWWALSGWVFFGAYASIESLVTHVPGGSRIIVLLLIIALTLRALLRDGQLHARAALSRKESSK